MTTHYYTCPKCKRKYADLYGNCGYCGMSEEGKKQYEEQIAEEKERQMHMKKGFCRYCNRKALKDKNLCKYHLDKSKLMNKGGLN